MTDIALAVIVLGVLVALGVDLEALVAWLRSRWRWRAR